MIYDDVNEQLKTLNERLARVEQILPTLSTRQDLSLLSTKAEVALLATKAEALLATKAEIALLATKAELREEGEKTRRHMDVLAEHLIGRMAMLYEGHTRTIGAMNGSPGQRNRVIRPRPHPQQIAAFRLGLAPWHSDRAIQPAVIGAIHLVHATRAEG